MTEQDKPTDPDRAPEVPEPDSDSGGAETAPTPPRPRTKSARNRAAGTGLSAADSGAADRGTADSGTADTGGPSADSRDSSDAVPGPTSQPRQISLTFTTAGLAKVLAVVVVIAAVMGVALLGWGYYQERQRLDAFDGSKAASEEFVTKLVSTMTKDGVGNMKELLGPLSTGEFRQHLEQQQSDTAQAVEQLNLQDAQSAVKSVSVETFDTDSARTAVLMEVSGKSAIAPEGGKSLMLLWLDLRHEDGRWLVSELSGAQAGIGEEQGGANGAQPAPAAPAPAG
ncbi:hypothetical protein ACIGKQ_00620 [Gordonia sp. NPDC062954]|uniref:Mce-associated membrane protein n=1 Tax=Gordonia aquimaris TaxID=2984863 RepID=A0A9X3I4X3_9ACTN|nr:MULTISPECIES: hypothetical protein [Gordonia]MAU81119.1 hypothetical protein [Gordonia sp. (in: high G+C Gram-positive bacteria)]MCX2963914.1 hypothetical protein [Gordonia aquimaris]